MRNIADIFNFENNKNNQDLGKLVQLYNFQVGGLLLAFFIPMCLIDPAKLHVPMTLVYWFFISYGLLSGYYEQSG